MKEIREKIIQNYIDGYNEFNVEKMTADMHGDVVFQNIQNGEVNLTLNGIAAFREQAEQVKSFFDSRKQKTRAIKHDGDKVEIEIDYSAVLAIEFSSGMKKGEKVELTGKSVFKFIDNKIIELTDIS